MINRQNRQDLQVDILRMAPHGRYQYVDVEFVGQHMDTVIPHGLRVENPEIIRWMDVRQNEVYTANGVNEQDGEWLDKAYASGDFTGSGTISWTVASGDHTYNRYCLIGNTMIWTLHLDNTSVSGTGTELRVTIPGNYTIAGRTFGRPALVIDAGAVVENARIQALAGNTFVQLVKNDGTNWGTGADNTTILFTLIVEVSEGPTQMHQVPIVYRASSADRVPFGPGYIVLRSNVAGYSTRLLIFEERTE